MQDKNIKKTDREIIDEQIQNLREQMEIVKENKSGIKEEKMISISSEIRKLIEAKKNLH